MFYLRASVSTGKNKVHYNPCDIKFTARREPVGPKPDNSKSINLIGRIFFLLGGLATILGCGMISGYAILDLAGAEATGRMTNISYDAKRTDNPFTAQVTFTAADGGEVSFISWQDRFYFELDERLKRQDGSAYPGVTVRYFESLPQLAKVTFVYHSEYVSRAVWLFWSFAALMIGVISLRNKPLVVSLRNKKE